MGRWKPPQAKSSPYITAQGYTHLEQELKAIWKRRKHVTNALAAAAAEGDRSENAEYIYRKKELREIDRRIHYLQKRMPELKIVTEVGDKKRIYFGATVTIEDEEGINTTYRIIGPDEIDHRKNYISIDSPMSKGLLGKVTGDEVIVRTAAKQRVYFITAIKYAPM